MYCTYIINYYSVKKGQMIRIYAAILMQKYIYYLQLAKNRKRFDHGF